MEGLLGPIRNKTRVLPVAAGRIRAAIAHARLRRRSGAVVAALATLLPCYLFTIIPAPYFRKHGNKPGRVACIDGVTAAAIGTITGAVFVLGKRSLGNMLTVLKMLITILLNWKVKKLPEPVIVAWRRSRGWSCTR